MKDEDLNENQKRQRSNWNINRINYHMLLSRKNLVIALRVILKFIWNVIVVAVLLVFAAYALLLKSMKVIN